MLKIMEVQRNYKGELINVILDDGQRLDLKELFTAVEQRNINGAFIDVDTDGNKHLHIVNDDDDREDLDILSLI